jgi:hypothetical protein
MNNPGMDFEIWKQLKKKWTDLDAKGHRLKIDFQLIAHPKEEDNVLAIDVVQHIDGKPVTETVQRTVGEAYAPLGIAGLSLERLVEVYKGMMQELRSQSELKDIAVTVTMVPTSSTSGELRGLLEVPDAPVQSPVQVNYQHYYVLNALRDRMVETLGEGWSSVRAVYHAGDLEFHFEYS